jgi:hypothetical protein
MSLITGRELFLEVETRHSRNGGGGKNRPNTKPVRWPAQNARARLVEEITALPESAIKDQLLTRVVEPYLTLKPPFSRTLAGTDLPVHSVDVAFQYKPMGDTSGGYFSILRPDVRATHIIDQPQTIDVPLIIGLEERDKALYPSTHRLPDGTPIMNSDLPSGRGVINGLSPLLGIERSTTLNPRGFEQFYETERFGFIKEGCTWLFSDILLEEVMKKMEKFSLKTKLLVRNKKTHQLEVIPAGINPLVNILNLGSRLLALSDLAPYLLAFRAIEGTSYSQTVESVPEYRNVIAEVAGTNYGNTPTELLYNSAAAVMKSLNIVDLYHQGNLSKLP